MQELQPWGSAGTGAKSELGTGQSNAGVSMWLDQQLVGNSDIEDLQPAESSQSVAIGVQIDGDNAFEGRIDELRIIKRRLSLEEITAEGLNFAGKLTRLDVANIEAIPE